VRFLMVELQHLGGLGLLMTVPYWESDEGKWVLVNLFLSRFLRSSRSRFSESYARPLNRSAPRAVILEAGVKPITFSVQHAAD